MTELVPQGPRQQPTAYHTSSPVKRILVYWEPRGHHLNPWAYAPTFHKMHFKHVLKYQKKSKENITHTCLQMCVRGTKFYEKMSFCFASAKKDKFQCF